MKLVRKILPLTALTIVGTIPVVATSCSNVYQDLLSKPYTPKDIAPLTAGEYTSSELEEAYYDYFKDHKGQLADDSLWGASLYARKIINYENPLTKCQTFLNHVYSFDISETESLTHRFSYKIKSQVQVRSDSAYNGGSYTIDIFDVYFEINNIECYMTYWNAFEDDTSSRTGDNPWQVWTICPTKYNSERGRWYQELSGNESLRFEIKAVYKGYSETGAQNYVREVSESAIVDEEHKYVPQLNEIYTNMMLLNSYFLSNAKPRLQMPKSTTSYITPSATEKVYDWSAKFNFGSQTCTDQHGRKVTFDTKPDVYSLYSPGGSGANVTKIEWVDKNPILVPENPSTKPEANFQITFDKEPYPGDIVYFCVHATCTDTATGDEWEEWFPISGIVSE